MNKLKVGIFLYILIGAMNLSVSYANSNIELEVTKTKISTELNR